MASTSQDGPVLVGGNDATNDNTRPLLIDTATGYLLVKTQGGGTGSDVNLIEVGGAAIALGQAAMAASLPVVVASDQTAIPVSGPLTDTELRASAVPVSAASLPLPTGAATLAEQQTQTSKLNGGLPAALGAGGGLKIDGSGTALPVSLASAPTTSVTQGTSPWVVGGDVAADDADTGNPVKVGGKAATSLPTAVAANDRTNLLSDVYGRPFVRHGAQGPAGNYWDVQHVPSANTQATATQSSAGSGTRNVCTGFTVTLASSSTTAPAAVQLTVAVIDGDSGGTTYLWRSVISLPAVAGAITSFVRSGLWLPGTAATGMTIEFSAAGGANTIESVTMEGTAVKE